MTFKSTSHTVLDVNTLVLNTVTPFNIYIKKSKDYVIIIETGTLLTDKVLKQLSQQQTLYAKKDDSGEKRLTYETLSFYIEANKNFPQKNIQFLYNVSTKLFSNMLTGEYSSINISCLESITKSVLFLIKENKNFLKDTIHYFSDDYILNVHSLHVAIYAMNLGNLLNFTDAKLLDLGVAGLLHDVGINKIDDNITHKNLELDEEEYAIVKKHPQLSVEIIEHHRIHNPYIIDGVLHHHERYDGSGYPDGLYDKQISDYASILAISDVFDALTNNRPHRKKHTYFEALKLMMKDESMQNQFNNDYLKTFLKSLI